VQLTDLVDWRQLLGAHFACQNTEIHKHAEGNRQKSNRDADSAVAEIWCTTARAIHDQQLMLHENGLGNDRAEISRTNDPENSGNEMNKENNQVTHGPMLTREEDGGF
jgi:hypothetical protein